MNKTLKQHMELKDGFLSMVTESHGKLADEEIFMLDTFLSTDSHFTLGTFMEKVRVSFPHLDRRDVKSFLSLLVDYGIARRELIDNKDRYEHFHLDEHHDHLVCMKCGAVENFFDDEIESRQATTATRHGFSPLVHTLVIHGLCPLCLKSLPEVFRLTKAFPGELLVVRDVLGGRTIRSHLASLGITKGIELTVSHGYGRPLVLVRGSRIALDRGMAAKIEVARVTSPLVDGEVRGD